MDSTTQRMQAFSKKGSLMKLATRQARYAFALAFSACLAIAVAATSAGQTNPGKSKARPASQETKALQALSENNQSELSQIQKEDDAADSNLFSMLGNRMVWQIQGTMDPTRLMFQVEYLCGISEKAYESLVVVEQKQLDRIERIAKSIKTIAEDKNFQIRIQVAWTENERIYVHEFEKLIEAQQRDRCNEFVEKLKPTELGWKSFNLGLNKKLLPEKPTAATLIVTVIRKQ